MGSVVPIRPDVLRQQRQDETTAAIGMMVALGSWGMMFAALFFVYLGLRSYALAWPPPGLPALPLLLPSINTLVIVASSLTLHRALKSARVGERTPALRWMGGTFALGLTFVGLQLLLWSNLWKGGITTMTGTLGTVVYGLTILHAAHVALGVLALGYIIVGVLRLADTPAKHALRLRMCGMFWHFVDIVWVLMFFGLFLL